MSKVICDVCGTTYPETAAQCPICNSAKSSADQTAADDGGNSLNSGYAPTKGGRFSKKNVRKRSKNGTAAQKRSARQDSGSDEPSNTGLVIVVVLLLIAIVAVVIYIGVHFFGNDNSGKDPGSTTTAPTQSQEQTQQNTENEVKIPCDAIQLSNKIIEFGAEGESWTLVVAVTPVDTTESVTFVSSDEAVVAVSSDGVLTAVGGGEAVITVTCGEAVDTCTVTCTFGETTPPTEEPTEPTVTGEFEFSWNTSFKDKSTGYGDATLSAQGKTWKAYKSSLKIDPADITWTSDDTSVCTIENGIVTAVGHGQTLVHASYNGVTYSCIIRCPFQSTSSDNGSTDETDPAVSVGSCKISHTDVTIAVDESFTLTLKDSEGNTLDVTWTADGDNVTIDGNKITGASSGTVKVSVTYEDVTYTCVVRVK